jgi:hypothetical protein
MDVKQLEELTAKFNQISLDNPLARATWDSKRWLVNSQKSGAAGDELKLLCIQAARAKGYSEPDAVAHWLDFIKECGFNYFETKNGSVSIGEDGIIQQANIGEIVDLANACRRACIALLDAEKNAEKRETSIRKRAFNKLKAPQSFPWMTCDEIMAVTGWRKSKVYEDGGSDAVERLPGKPSRWSTVSVKSYALAEEISEK